LVTHDSGDGYVETLTGQLTFGIKCARVNIANRYLGQEAENWAFSNILKSPAKVEKRYDILIAIGVLVLGLEDKRYWDYLRTVQEQYRAEGRIVLLDAKPHQAEFLSICSLFVIPFIAMSKNFFRLTIHSISKSNYSQYWAWGDDETRCKAVWDYAAGRAKQDR
jgi:hypothetical protein